MTQLTITEALANLDVEGPDEVAQILRQAGAKGQQGCGGLCPITNYLRAQTGLPDVWVTMTVVYPDGLLQPEDSILLPKAVRQFICRFDGWGSDGYCYLDLRGPDVPVR